MAVEFNYSSTAVETTLSGSIGSGDTSLSVGATTGFPTAPFKLTIAHDTPSEEIVKVTAVVGLALTVVRGWDGSAALAHSAGDPVKHQATGEDLRLSRQHEDAEADVHGIGATAAVVGTTTVQTLEGKTIDSTDNTLIIAQADVPGLVAALAAKVDDSQIHASWLTALGLALDADAATVLGALAAGWPGILAVAPGTNWAAALAAPLDADAATVLGALATGWTSILAAAPGTNWPAALAATLDTDAATVLGAMGTGWPATLAATIASLRPSFNENDTDIENISSTSGVPGSPVVGVSFVAPPSGMVAVTVSGFIASETDGQAIILGWEQRTGGTIGAGTIELALDDNRSIIAGRVVNAGSPFYTGGSNRYLRTGLTPGSSYNVRCMHYVTGAATHDIFYRSILVEPVL